VCNLGWFPITELSVCGPVCYSDVNTVDFVWWYVIMCCLIVHWMLLPYKLGWYVPHPQDCVLYFASDLSWHLIKECARYIMNSCLNPSRFVWSIEICLELIDITKESRYWFAHVAHLNVNVGFLQVDVPYFVYRYIRISRLSWLAMVNPEYWNGVEIKW